MRLRWYLALLVLATLGPLFGFAAFITYRDGVAYRRTVEQGLLETARALAIALDERFDASMQILGALGTSEHLDRGDLQTFYRQAQRVQEIHQEWVSVSLFDASGRRLLHTLEPFGAPLPGPPPVMSEPFRRLVETRRAGVSDLFPSPVRKGLRFSIGVPVVRDGQVRYVLSAGIDASVLHALIARQRVPADGVLTMLDRQYVTAARSRAPELIGRKAGAALVARARAATDGWNHGPTREGIVVYSAFSRSPVHGWTTVLGVPAASVDAAAMDSVKTIVGVGVALLLAAGLLVVWIGRRVSHPIESIVIEAERLGRGETPEPVPSTIRELAGLSASLAAAGRARARAEDELRTTQEQLL